MAKKTEKNILKVNSNKPLEKIETSANDDQEPINEKHQAEPIAEAIDKLALRASDICFSAITFIASAEKWQIDQLKKHSKEVNRYGNLIESDDDTIRASALKHLLKSLYKFNRIKKSEVVRTLEIGHFLSLFSAFDAYTGELLSAIYNKNHDLFKGINRSLTISEMLKYENIEDVKTIILQNEIENFRRKSYVEQFESLESRFSINLKKFSKWPEFVECSQRRNLLTHCDGLVSDQYVQICTKEGCKFDPPIKPGTKLGLSPEYLINSCHLIIEVALKLGQTLWRVQFDSELDKADDHLHTTQYDFLIRDDLELALMAGEFACGLPKHSGETIKTIMLINYVIACKFTGDNDKANKLLDSKDWGPLCSDFKLAVAILKDNYTEAASIMKKIGQHGEYVNEQAYHEWPMLNNFRESKEFQDAYNEIYGYQFVKELKRSANKVKDESKKQIEIFEKAFKGEPKVECSATGSGLTF
jgi:hypothetical protein